MTVLIVVAIFKHAITYLIGDWCLSADPALSPVIPLTSRAPVISIGEVNALHPHLITSPNYLDKSLLAFVSSVFVLPQTKSPIDTHAHTAYCIFSWQRDKHTLNVPI